MAFGDKNSIGLLWKFFQSSKHFLKVFKPASNVIFMGNCCPMRRTHGSDSHEGISILFIPLKSRKKLTKNFQ